LWKNIKNLLPGSEQSQIKEITEKLGNTAQLITLNINIQQTRHLSKVTTISQNKKFKYEDVTAMDTLQVQNTLDLATLRADILVSSPRGPSIALN